MKNIGVLKHHIRKEIIVQDKVEDLKPLLPHLSHLDRNSLLSTCAKYDAIECFKVLDTGYRLNIVEHLPVKILLHLVENAELFHATCHHIEEKKLADYFCKGFALHKVATVGDAILFHYANNPKPTQAVLDLIKNDRIENWQVKLVIRKETSLKPFCDKYEKVWNALSRQSKENIDYPRCRKDDWKQLQDFPWKGFLDMPVFLMCDLLQSVYPENSFLFEKMKSVRYIEKFQKSWRRGQIRHNDWMELQDFPWNGFLNMPVYLMWNILQMVYPRNSFLFCSVKTKSVEYVQKFQTSWRKLTFVQQIESSWPSYPLHLHNQDKQQLVQSLNIA